MLEECASYLDACIYNIKKKKVMVAQEAQSSLGIPERLKRQKYLCKSHIQLCALLSQLGQHENALVHGKAAAKKCEQFLTGCYLLCTDHLSKHRAKSLKPQKKKILQKPQYIKFHELALKSVCTFEYLLAKLKNKRSRGVKAPKLDMRTVLGVQRHNDWIFNFNIGDMMIIQPLSVGELKTGLSVQAELTRDLMIEKILMTVVSHFCIATEIRFLSSSTSKYQSQEAKIWHKRALDIGTAFLPTSCPLLHHIMNSYVRNYSEGFSEANKSVEKKIKKVKNITPNPELRRPRSTSTSKVRKDDRPLTANSRSKKRPSPRVGDRTPPARPKEKVQQFRFNSPAGEKKRKLKQVKVQKMQDIEENPMEYGKKSISRESEVDQEIVISSYDLYGINSDDDSQSSEISQIDSTGGKLNQEPVVISATGGNSCVYKGIEDIKLIKGGK